MCVFVFLRLYVCACVCVCVCVYECVGDTSIWAYLRFGQRGAVASLTARIFPAILMGLNCWRGAYIYFIEGKLGSIQNSCR